MRVIKEDLTRIEFKDLMEALYKNAVSGEPYWFNDIYLMDEDWEPHRISNVDLFDSRFRCHDGYFEEYDDAREYCVIYVR